MLSTLQLLNYEVLRAEAPLPHPLLPSLRSTADAPPKVAQAPSAAKKSYQGINESNDPRVVRRPSTPHPVCTR